MDPSHVSSGSGLLNTEKKGRACYNHRIVHSCIRDYYRLCLS